MLEKHQATVTVAETGFKAIEIAATEKFDAILMDLQMPGMDGITAASKIKEANGPNQNTPIIPMTANVGPEFEARTEAVGMVGFIAKPLNPEEMMATIRSCTSTVT